jgi:hypothetical protein
MTVENQDFTVYAGEYKRITVTVTGTIAVDDIVVADWYVNRQVLKTIADMTLTNITGGITVAWSLNEADTTALKGTFHHALVLEDLAGNPGVVTRGAMKVQER